MPIIKFSQRDLLRGTVVSPAWYRMKIEAVGESPAKDQSKGPSINYPVEGTILFNGDNGDTQFSGVPVDWNFNSKAIGFAVGFLKSFGIEVVADKRFDLKAAEGLEIDVFVDNDIFNNRPVNRVNHQYRQIRPDVTPVQR